MLLLRRYNLEADLKHNPTEAARPSCTRSTGRSPRPTSCIRSRSWPIWRASGAEPMNRRKALELHGLAMVQAYHYLFDERFGRYRNPVRSRVPRRLRSVQRRPGKHAADRQEAGQIRARRHATPMRSANQTIEATIVLRGNGWRADDFEGFRFVSDYEIRGLQNQYHTYGLGVPLIAVRKHHAESQRRGEVLSARAELSRSRRSCACCPTRREQGSNHHVVHIELHDPLNTVGTSSVDGRGVPLESDLTTPLAYALNQKRLRNLDSSTAGLLDPAQTEKLQGLYMLEPYQPGKIPVLMVHGLWSSPITWMEMFNDLRRAPEIRRPLPVLVLPVSQRPAVLGQRRQAARRPGRGPPDHRPATPPAGARPDGAGRPQHGRAGRRAADDRQPQRLLEHGQRQAVSGRQGLGRNAARPGRHVLLPPQSVDPPRDHDRHAVPRQPVRQHRPRAGWATS